MVGIVTPQTLCDATNQVSYPLKKCLLNILFSIPLAQINQVCCRTNESLSRTQISDKSKVLVTKENEEQEWHFGKYLKVFTNFFFFLFCKNDTYLSKRHKFSSLADSSTPSSPFLQFILMICIIVLSFLFSEGLCVHSPPCLKCFCFHISYSQKFLIFLAM